MPDVIVVGARCGGAPTAMLLARRGYDVVLLDRGRFPSDHTLSTHVVWHDGAERLHRWGLLDKAVVNCPPIHSCTLDLGLFSLTGIPPSAGTVKDAYAPRRLALDNVLVGAAVAAGAELREECTLDELVVENGQVVGARLRSSSGTSITENASLVIGADGWNSAVARAAGAVIRDERPALQGTSWSYWSGVDLEGVVLYTREHRGIYAFPTSDGLTLVGANFALPEYTAAHDIEDRHLAALAEIAPDLALRVVGERERNVGTPARRFNVVRKPWGPGWALVGDASCVKDPCTARGISDAFRDAELLADAVHAALSGRRSMDDALAEYGNRRDEATLPMFEFTCQLARFDPPPPAMQQVFAALREHPDQVDRFWGVFAGTVSVEAFFSPENVSDIVSPN